MFRKSSIALAALLVAATSAIVPAQAAAKISNGVACAKKNATVKVGGNYELIATVQAVFATDASTNAQPLGQQLFASASLYDIFAKVSSQAQGAQANFDISGDVTLSATSPVDAYASLWNVYARANANALDNARTMS